MPNRYRPPDRSAAYDALITHLRALRLERGMTLVQAAALIDPPITPATLSGIERMVVPLTATVLRQLAMVYEADPMEIARLALVWPMDGAT